MAKVTRRACLANTIAAMQLNAQQTARHTRHMRRAIELSAKTPKLPFAALLVDANDRIIAEGWNQSGENPIFHGEIDVINNCARTHKGIDWSTLTLYTTAEPCPMCQGAVAWSGISTVVFGTSIPFLQSLEWWQIDIRADEIRRRTPFRKCTLIGGVLEDECNSLFVAAKAMQE